MKLHFINMNAIEWHTISVMRANLKIYQLDSENVFVNLDKFKPIFLQTLCLFYDFHYFIYNCTYKLVVTLVIIILA